ncbi:MAG: FHIPEP family type III secretion protein [Myxococcales bacterium]|nr:FHIPEP family type III secretion protein [Myxococcales bacterium]
MEHALPRAEPSAFHRYADVLLAALVVLIVGMMIVPLPTALLDLLLASNISLAVVLLLVALYARSGLAFASFPTVLLVTTLYRLALNVSSTRLILLQANAGDVIHSFGTFVVRGNYVVGAVIFLILTLIQFIVIAKGSERVAEVGARFTLDAMPGKQMSIDAELRSGAITQDEAQQRRRRVQRESEFFGAMDGAMKFVKGDAIAGIIITLINIAAGLVIGVGMRHLGALESLKVYGLLTIGDGLVSQIPALLISTAAGLVVTRVSSEHDDSSLAGDIARQVLEQPRALAVAGVFLLVLAAIPGLPTIPFVVLGALLLFGARRLRETPPRTTGTDGAPAIPGRQAAAAPLSIPAVVPISVDLGERLATDDHDAIQTALAELPRTLFLELGLPVPSIRTRTNAQLPPYAFTVFVQEIPVGSGDASPRDTQVTPREAVVAHHTARAIRRRAAEFVGLQETQALLDQLERLYPALVRNAVPKPVSLQLLSEVLRRLVDEGVSIRPLREILEALASHAPHEKDPVALTELVRSTLKRHISFRVAQGGVVPVYLLAPEIEEAVRDAIQRTVAGSYLALAPDLAREILTSIKRTCAAHTGHAPNLLTQSDIRRFVRRLIEVDLPDVLVLSYQELAPELTVQPLARVDI